MPQPPTNPSIVGRAAVLFRTREKVARASARSTGRRSQDYTRAVSQPNPFESSTAPFAPDVAPSADRARVLAAAEGQRYVNLMLLATLLMFPLTAVLGETVGVVVLAVLQLTFVVAMVVVVYRAARGLWGTGTGVLCALFSWVPIVNLILLLAISSSATTLLRTRGFRVGLLGTDLTAVRAWAQQG